MMQSLKLAKIKKGSKVKSLLCFACLTSDRKLFALNKSAEYEKIWKLIVQEVATTDVSICWECLALLKNVKKFQEKVKFSQCLLKLLGDVESCLLNNHSKLSKSHTTIIDSKLGLVTAETERVLEEEKREIEIKRKENDTLDDFDISDDLLEEKEEDSVPENAILEEVRKPEIKIKQEENDTTDDFDISDNILEVEKDSVQENDILEEVKTPEIKIKQEENDTTDDFDISDNILEVEKDSVQENDILEEVKTPEIKIKQEENYTTKEFKISDDLSGNKLKDNTPENYLKEDIGNTVKDLPEDFINLKNEPVQGDYQNRSLMTAEPIRNKIDTEIVSEKKRTSYRYILQQSNVQTGFTRLAISFLEVNHWMEKERNSIFFKGLTRKCVQCAKAISKKNLDSHNMEVHSKNKFICDYCKRSCKTKGILEMHINYHTKLYSCNTCDFKSIHFINICDHVRVAHSKVFKCLDCDESFSSYKGFYAHHSITHRKRLRIDYRKTLETFICDYCKNKFRQKRLIEGHIARHHTRQKCADCGRHFSNYFRLKDHKYLKHRIQRNEATYCAICDKQYDNMSLFRKHLVSAKHAGERPSKSSTCPVCARVYMSLAGMKYHYKKEHTEDRWQCADCDKTFVSKSCLKTHAMYVHQRKKKTKNKICTHCERAFSSATLLKRHVLIHTGERPHKCPHCEQTFTQRQSMLRHVKSMHAKEQRSLPRTDDRSHNCPHCDRPFAKKTAMLEHVKRLHPKKERSLL